MTDRTNTFDAVVVNYLRALRRRRQPRRDRRRTERRCDPAGMAAVDGLDRRRGERRRRDRRRSPR